MNKRWLVLGGALALCAVATGALGDHLIRPKLEEWFPADAEKRLANWEIASRYLFYHALAICVVGLLPRQVGRFGVHLTGILFVLGIGLFSGCLFGYVLSGQKSLVQFVPLGGGCFLLGWLTFMIAMTFADSTPNT